MSKSLVIVESPAKAKTISKYLGSEYIVQSSVGHIRDLPKKGMGTVNRLSIPKHISPEEKARLKVINDRKRLIRRMGIGINLTSSILEKNKNFIWHETVSNFHTWRTNWHSWD